jgi:hypothetical protein
MLLYEEVEPIIFRPRGGSVTPRRHGEADALAELDGHPEKPLSPTQSDQRDAGGRAAGDQRERALYQGQLTVEGLSAPGGAAGRSDLYLSFHTLSVRHTPKRGRDARGVRTLKGGSRIGHVDAVAHAGLGGQQVVQLTMRIG